MSDEEQKKRFAERIKKLDGRPSASSMPNPGPVHDIPKTRAQMRAGQQSPTMMSKLVPFVIGAILGVICAIVLDGAMKEFSPWGPGTAMNTPALAVGFGGFILAFLGLFVGAAIRKTRPGLMFFSLAMLCAYIITFVI